MNTRICDAYQALYNTREEEGNPLKGHNHPALLARWGADPSTLETQIMCLPSGTKMPDSNKYEQNGEVFGPQRWPYDAAGEPNYNNPPISYIIRNRLKCIGTTWWDWKNKRTTGLGFDFDSIVGHAEGVGVSDEVISRLDKIDVPWLEIVRSTRGSGRHLYIWFQEPYPVTVNHTEHAAIARAFLPLIEKYTGLDINASVDVCGGVMWIYHRAANKENRGYEQIKPATQILTADYVPPTWRDNLEVVSGGRARVRVQGWTPDGEKTKGDELDEMTEAFSKTPLDETHLSILEALEGTGHTSLWVHDHHLWQGHTGGLKAVYLQFQDQGTPLKGLFDTNSLDSDPGKANCFMRPRPQGGWDVYRFGEGVNECDLWDQQGKWTHIQYNCCPTLRQICVYSGGFEASDPKLGFMFSDIEELRSALKLLGSKISVPEAAAGDRQLSLLESGGKIILRIEKKSKDTPASFKYFSKTSKGWERPISDTIEVAGEDSEAIFNELDRQIRALKIRGETDVFDSWVIRDDDSTWTTHPKDNVKAYLASIGIPKPDEILGQAIFKPWVVVSKPFQPEYPGGRVWNRNAIQFAFEPLPLRDGQVALHPHWDIVLNHCGRDLDDYIGELLWCKDWGITCGGDYLRAWVACMIRYPECKLPYLFMYGAQNSGKSTFHEAVAELFVQKRGVVRADRALTSEGDFNGELEGALLAFVDEIDVSRAGLRAYNKLKDWTTGLTLQLHCKGKQPYEVPNTLHFVQMGNSRNNLPVFPGDTRITAMHVEVPEKDIPKDLLMSKLIEEGPGFLRTILDMEIPEPTGRLRLPVIETQGKQEIMDSNEDPLEAFIASGFKIPGAFITLKDFKAAFYALLDPVQVSQYNQLYIKKKLLEKGIPVGIGKGNRLLVGNYSLTECQPTEPFTLKGTRLRRDK